MKNLCNSWCLPKNS